jgi:hypothetical protein
MEQKKSHTARNITIVVIMVLLVLIFGFIAYNSYQRSSPPTFTETLSGTITVDPLAYRYLTITVPSGASDPILSIYFIAQGGTRNDIRCFVMDETNFIDWRNGHPAFILYVSGQVPTAKGQISLPGPGTYYIVFDNTFSVFSSKTVNYSITLKYTYQR